MGTTPVRTLRSGTFLTAFQLEGVIAGLRHAISCGMKPGDATVKLLNRIREDFQQDSQGLPVDRLPFIDEDFGPTDILVAAEMFHRTVIAFLTPEEAEAQRKIGSDPKNASS